MPTFGLSQRGADTHGAAEGWMPPHHHGKISPSLINPFLGLIFSIFAGFFPRSHSTGCNGTAEPRPSLERGREREIHVGIILLLPFFVFKITFKENILVLTRIYLLYSCIWLLAWVPNRQRFWPGSIQSQNVQ